MRRFLRQARLVTGLALFFALPALVASAANGSGSYFNGFEQNTAGWHGYVGSTIHREPSGYVSSNGYAAGVPSADGSWHARLGIDQSPNSCAGGGGQLPWLVGPYTDWGGPRPFTPPGGWLTRVDIYLDVAWAATHADRRFDWSSAVADPSGNFRRDYVFNVGTVPTGFVISGSNNSTRCGAFPANPANTPYNVLVSGWYTFEHDFVTVPGMPLVVIMRLIKDDVTLATWTRSDPTDIVGVTVGDSDYGWFVQNEIDELAIDNSERTGLVSTPGCEVKISDGGWITTPTLSKGTFGGNAKVDLDGNSSGNQTYHDHRAVAPVGFKALTVDTVLCNDDRTSAELYGTGTVEGVPGEVQYRIKLEDNGEGITGTGDKYGITIPDIGYTTGDQPLQGGNVNIR
jgi:hypothetical protein